MTRHMLIAVLLAAAGASSAVAQVSSIGTASPARKFGKAGDVVCETEEKTGSRLGARRVCMTIAERAERKREHREATEKVQETKNQSPSN